MTIDADPAPAKRGIESAVAAEWRRRRRVSRFYLALLLIPIAAAFYAVRYGQSERAVVANRVVPEVTERVAQGLDERVAARVRVEAPPVLRSVMIDQVEPALEQIRNKQATLATTVASVQTGSTEWAAAAPEVPKLQAAVRDFDAKLMSVRREVADAKTESAGRFQAYEPDLNRLTKLFGEVEQLRTSSSRATDDIAEVRNRLEKMNAYGDRIAALDAALKSLSDRVGKLEALGSAVDHLGQRVSKAEALWPAVQQLDKRVARLEAVNKWTSPQPVEPPKP